MKKFSLLIVISITICFHNPIKSQDIIKLNGDQELKVKIIKEYNDSIQFYYWGDASKTVQSVKKILVKDIIKNFNSGDFPTDKETGKVIYSEVVNIDKTADDVYNITKEWFNTNPIKFFKTTSMKGSGTNDGIWGTKKSSMATTDLKFKSESKITLDDPVGKKIIGHAVIKYFGSSYGNVRMVYITYDIKVLIKENKYRYEISNFNIEHYNPYTEQKMGFGTTSDKGPCASTGTLETLFNCDISVDAINKMYTVIDSEVHSIIDDLKDYIRKTTIKSDW